MRDFLASACGSDGQRFRRSGSREKDDLDNELIAAGLDEEAADGDLEDFEAEQIDEQIDDEEAPAAAAASAFTEKLLENFALARAARLPLAPSLKAACYTKGDIRCARSWSRR